MDPRREHSLIDKHVQRRNREVGEVIVWYEFKPLATSGSYYDDIYDEGAPGAGGRTYASGVLVPTIYIAEIEDQYRAIPEARQPVQIVSATILVRDMVESGISNVREYKEHLNDVFEYDDRYYKVREYSVRGRLNKEHKSGEVLVAITGFEVVMDQEFPFSYNPRNTHSTLPWPSTFPS